MNSVRTSRPARILVAFTILLTTVALVSDAVAPSTAMAQLTPIDDEPGNEAPGLGDIIGSPDAGPDPEDAGDRGGWAQLTLALLLLGGVLFIGSRILHESRQGRQVATPSDEPSPEAK